MSTTPAKPTAREALDMLSKLEQAAPTATARRLRQIQRLIQDLSAENEYFNTLVTENTTMLEPEQPQPQIIPDSNLLMLLAGMNDGMRAPLVAIRGRAELIQAGFLGQITDEQNVWLNAIEENTTRAFALLDTVQQIVDLQSGKTHLEPANFVPTELLEEARDRVIDAATTRQHEISIHVPETVPLAYGDFYNALIILTDILDNAIYYTPPGGSIRLSVDNLGTHALFSVVDNGIGLTAEDTSSIGQPFWRGSNRLVRQHPGNGLRLFLAQQVLTLQESELIFSGEPGLGSTFSFILPIPKEK